MAKRFTDINKWRNEWFRTLPDKAKLTWIYLCDECDFCGVWKADYGLASFQLNSKISLTNLLNWFGDKIHVFDADKILIVPFFEFQYSSSKDSWTAKLRAREKLEAMGFEFETPNKLKTPTLPPLSPHVGGTGLIKGIVEVKGEGVVSLKSAEKLSFEKFYARYPVRLKGPSAEQRFAGQIKTAQDEANLDAALTHYIAHLAKKENSWRKPKQSFSAFLGTEASGFFWREWIESDAGTTTIDTAKSDLDQWMEEQRAKERGLA